VLTLARHLPARFDVAAETILRDGSAMRLAHQVRQDLWRALQNLRGFSPVVQVTRRPNGMHIKAGGAVTGALPKSKVEAQIAALLEAPDLRRRWERFATKKGAPHA
jgi:hypothetical protein